MERVETLCSLLAEKIRQKAPLTDLLSTVRMLESELIHLKNTAPESSGTVSAAVNISKQYEKSLVPAQPAAQPVEEKTIEILQIDEAEVEAELEEIKRNAEERNKISGHNKPQLIFDGMDDIPTLAGRTSVTSPKPVSQAKEIHELLPVNKAPSFNDVLKTQKNEVADSLQDSPVKDLRKAIGVNDRYGYINSLFRGDEAMYERSIKTINSFAIFPEAEYWIRRELKLKLGWDDKNEIVQQFDQLVRRRFS